MTLPAETKIARFTNRLIHETSPYLKQHAHNPVDWHAWDAEALQLAKTEDKPILLSIGYSACHWCHVMERESFENEQIAAIMNRHFVNIKVDREERPDLDAIYMSYVQMTTGSGGWPMTVFLTPDQVPFFGGTYFPPDDRYGRPGFPQLCEAVSSAYRSRRKEIEESGPNIVKSLEGMNYLPDPQGVPAMGTLEAAFRNLAQRFDLVHGGFGGPPKFPGSMNLSFCLRYYHRTQLQPALDFVELSLDKMASGGIYDQLGGGFHRYSVDGRWLVPHFEKMLYDNALLTRVYLDAFQLTGNPLYRRVVEETLDYVIREMTHPAGGFYSTQDADSEGEEGKFFVWEPAEIEAALGTPDAQVFCRAFDVTRSGNFEGKNILNLPRPLHRLAEEEKMPPEELERLLQRCRKHLFAARETRVKPHRDEKVLTSWNGLMLVSFARAAAVLAREDYLRVAEENARFVADHLARDGRLLRSWKDGQAKLNGYLEDYAFFIEGLIALFESTGKIDWLRQAVAFNETLLDQFWDEASSSFYLTGRDHEQLIARVRDFYDNATPAGSSVAVLNLMRLSILTGRSSLREKAEANLSCMKAAMERHPGGFGYLLEAADFFIGPVQEIVVAGSNNHPRTSQLHRTIHGRYLPNKIVAPVYVQEGSHESEIPLLAGKTLIKGKPAAYVCRNYTCQAPATTAEALEKLLLN